VRATGKSTKVQGKIRKINKNSGKDKYIEKLIISIKSKITIQIETHCTSPRLNISCSLQQNGLYSLIHGSM
jgi:hypothetical protein